MQKRSYFKWRSFIEDGNWLLSSEIWAVYISGMSHAELDTITLVEFEVLTTDVIKSYIFCEITPWSPLKVNRRFRWICQVRNPHNADKSACFTPVSCLAFSSTLKLEAAHSSETSVDFQLSTRYVLLYSLLNLYFHTQYCWNIKFTDL
jgi:hypothetical protein